MAWVESVSPSFTARHESEHADDAAAVLELLERTRDRMAQLFPETVGDVEVVLHSRPALLDFAHPLLPLERLVTAPAARRYLAGAVSGPQQIHVLAPALLKARASNVPGSR